MVMIEKARKRCYTIHEFKNRYSVKVDLKPESAYITRYKNEEQEVFYDSNQTGSDSNVGKSTRR